MVQLGCDRPSEEAGKRSEMCLHHFVARYTNSSTAVEVFKNAVDKYVYLAVVVQGFISRVTNMDKNVNLNKTREAVMPVDTGMAQLSNWTVIYSL
ncbi:hypothetical protein AAVH_23102 [Aphelenchoides avenae]|nr:hypothetical protein AAVH_23102 [Aphelenchus avenae]